MKRIIIFIVCNISPLYAPFEDIDIDTPETTKKTFPAQNRYDQEEREQHIAQHLKFPTSKDTTTTTALPDSEKTQESIRLSAPKQIKEDDNLPTKPKKITDHVKDFFKPLTDFFTKSQPARWLNKRSIMKETQNLLLSSQIIPKEIPTTAQDIDQQFLHSFHDESIISRLFPKKTRASGLQNLAFNLEANSDKDDEQNMLYLKKSPTQNSLKALQDKLSQLDIHDQEAVINNTLKSLQKLYLNFKNPSERVYGARIYKITSEYLLSRVLRQALPDRSFSMQQENFAAFQSHSESIIRTITLTKE